MDRERSDQTQREKRGIKLERLLWIQHEEKLVYFSPVEGFEEKEFRNQSDLMDYARACVNSGYHIG